MYTVVSALQCMYTPLSSSYYSFITINVMLLARICIIAPVEYYVMIMQLIGQYWSIRNLQLCLHVHCAIKLWTRCWYFRRHCDTHNYVLIFVWTISSHIWVADICINYNTCRCYRNIPIARFSCGLEDASTCAGFPVLGAIWSSASLVGSVGRCRQLKRICCGCRCPSYGMCHRSDPRKRTSANVCGWAGAWIENSSDNVEGNVAPAWKQRKSLKLRELCQIIDLRWALWERRQQEIRANEHCCNH